MTAEQAAEYIIENIDEFRTKYAGTIARFEGAGIERKLAEAMAITIAANAKALADAMNA